DDDTTLAAPTESPKVEDLTIDALQYNIEPQSTNSSSVPKPKITVQGEIVNHSKTYKQVPDLNVYVWGTCPEKCLLLTWQHKMFHKQLMPGERFPFKTTADVQTPENIVST
ncbi:MAG: hypothetical protein HYS39_03610, partial [Proteobacteria bacterium]|nr:hypothetical protein [Pseudomonadota bacterium]